MHIVKYLWLTCHYQTPSLQLPWFKETDTPQWDSYFSLHPHGEQQEKRTVETLDCSDAFQGLKKMDWISKRIQFLDIIGLSLSLNESPNLCFPGLTFRGLLWISTLNGALWNYPIPQNSKIVTAVVQNEPHAKVHIPCTIEMASPWGNKALLGFMLKRRK